MKLIVGLGNPGDEYERTRHNVGFMLVDSWAKSSWKKSKSGLLVYSWLGPTTELIKPQQYMNRSGEAVKYATKKHDVSGENLLVIHDDLDIPFGEWKMQYGVGPKVHNGLNSIINDLGDKDFWRIRVGIDSRVEEEKRIPGEKYVLSKFSNEEVEKLGDIFEEIKTKIGEWCA